MLHYLLGLLSERDQKVSVSFLIIVFDFLCFGMNEVVNVYVNYVIVYENRCILMEISFFFGFNSIEESNQNSKSATIEMYAPSSYNDTVTGETLSSVSEKSDSYSNDGSQPDYMVCSYMIHIYTIYILFFKSHAQVCVYNFDRSQSVSDRTLTLYIVIYIMLSECSIIIQYHTVKLSVLMRMKLCR